MASLKRSCRAVRAALVDFAEGTLDATARKRVEDHVAACATCAGRLEALRAGPSRLAALTPEPGEAFWREQREAILARVRDAQERPRRVRVVVPRRPVVPFPRSAVFAAVLALAIAYVGWSRFQTTFRPSIQAAGSPLPVPNDVVALDDATLVALAELAETIATPAPGAPGLERLTAAERAALAAWLDDARD